MHLFKQNNIWMAVLTDCHLYILTHKRNCCAVSTHYNFIYGEYHMFVNEYVMTRKRYDKWAAPKFWRLPIFYVYCIIFAAGTFGWIYFHHVGASLRWQSVGATLSFIALYRGVFFKWMHADKTFRVTRAQYFNGKDWTCKVMIIWMESLILIRVPMAQKQTLSEKIIW